ncbi:MAG: Synechococcus phage, partial [Cyanobacteriota bacterium]
MPRAIRRLFSTPLLLLGGLALATPVLGQQAGQAVDATCRTMGPRAVEAICLSILLGSLIALALMERRLRAEGWSLADALSEPVTVGHNGGGGAPTIRRDASSSRLIAMAGMLVILLLYLGFGVFCLYSFGMTCTMPAESDAAARFLYSGLTLFAPYIANKFSNVFKPLIGRAGRPGAALAPAPAPAPDGVEPEPEAATPPAAAQPRQPSPAQAATPAAAAAPQRPAATAAASGRPAPPPHAAASPSPVAAPASARPAAAAPSTTTTAAAAVPAATGDADRDPDQAAVTLIADFEGFVDHAYPDPASGGAPWTIGYGFTTLQGRPVQPGDRLSRAEADELLRTGVAACAAHLAGTIPHWQEMADDQRCALISFAWNLGENFYGDSSDFATISRVLRERRWAEVPDALLLYCNPGTAVEAGLRRRRQAEGDLWRRG